MVALLVLMRLTTRSVGVGVVSDQSFGSSVVSHPCITSMCSVQCFPGSHSLRSAFGSFFYRLILAVFCCSVKLCSFFVVFGYAWLLCNHCFFVIWGDNLGGTIGVLFNGCFVWHFMVRKFNNSLWCCRETERLWFCVYLLSGQAALELSDQAVHERSCPRA